MGRTQCGMRLRAQHVNKGGGHICKTARWPHGASEHLGSHLAPRPYGELWCRLGCNLPLGDYFGNVPELGFGAGQARLPRLLGPVGAELWLRLFPPLRFGELRLHLSCFRLVPQLAPPTWRDWMTVSGYRQHPSPPIRETQSRSGCCPSATRLLRARKCSHTSR